MRNILLTILLLALSLRVLAIEGFAVADIRVEGLQRIPASTVFANLPFSINDPVNDALLGEAIRRLFATGNFQDIELGREDDVLVVRVVERPAIGEIKIEGNKAIKEEDLLDGLKKSGLAQGLIFRQATLEGVRQELQRQYVAQGRYDARVVVEARPLGGNRVALYIDIDEGTVAKIKHLNIVGNLQFDDKTLLKQFEMQPTGWLSWTNSEDKYARERMRADLEKLESFYRDQGYLKFNIVSAQVSLSPERDAVFITISVDEGKVYKVANTKLSGELILPQELMESLVLLKAGDTYSQSKVTSTEELMSRLLGNNGYTYASIRSYPTINEADGTVELTFFVDPGKRTYVNRIKFYGNLSTQDEVLRREVRQMEAAPASGQLIEQSRVRLERLGFFKSVESEMVDVPGTDDQVDVVFNVEEQHSGSVGASIGYADGSGLVLSANLQQNNFLGSGKQVSVGVDRNDYQTRYSFSYNNPYYTIDGVSRGFNLFYRKTDFDKLGVAEYSSNSYGASLSYGYPISETARIGFGVGYARIELEVGPYAPQEVIGSPRDLSLDYFVSYKVVNGEILPVDGVVKSLDTLLNAGIDPYLQPTPGFVDLHGDTYDSYTLNGSIRESKLNRGLMPTAGHSQSLSIDLGVPGSDLEYYKLNYAGQIYVPLAEELSLRFHTRLGYGDGFGDTGELPFFEHFFAGGFGSVRGYERSSLGPRGTPATRYLALNNQAYAYDELAQKLIAFDIGSSADSFGGNVLVEGGGELIFPLWFVEDRRSLRTTLFVDVGNVFDTGCGDAQRNCNNVDLTQLRGSYGFGLTWISALGPLTFSLARPFNDTRDDRPKFFQFSIGSGF